MGENYIENTDAKKNNAGILDRRPATFCFADL